MALINCPECNKQVSDKAPACPHCGYTEAKLQKSIPIPKQIPSQKKAPTQYGCGTIILLITVFGFIYVNLFKDEAPSAQTPPAAHPKALSQSEQDMQAKRLTFIQNQLNNGIFTKIEMGNIYPHLFVTQEFLAGDFDLKTKIVAVVYAYHNTIDPKRDMVIIHSSITGNEIGKYSGAGLKFD